MERKLIPWSSWGAVVIVTGKAGLQPSSNELPPHPMLSPALVPSSPEREGQVQTPSGHLPQEGSIERDPNALTAVVVHSLSMSAGRSQEP